MSDPFFISKDIEMINCKLNRDIALGSSSGGNECMSVTINVGLMDGLYIFNIDDVENLVFEGDGRPDESLFVDTIVTSQPFYRVDATDITYNEEYEDHSYSHSLTASIKSVRNEIEEILESAVHGKYLVAFKVFGETNYRLVGWKEGLSLDEELTISSENNAYTLTFDGTTTYPIMECDRLNFFLSEKEYEPIFEPLFAASKVTCLGGDTHNGWVVANYVVKVNAAGQALDRNNKLTQYSGLPQDAYKLQGVSDGEYNIIGTYDNTAYFEGKSVRLYDTTLCEVHCIITLTPNTAINFNSTVTSATLTVYSTNDWEVVTYPSTVTLSRTYGTSADTTVQVYSNGDCGGETITFKNKVGGCTTSIGINCDIIKIGNIYYYPNGTTNIMLQPIICGEYTATTTEGNVEINSDGSFTVSGISTNNNDKTVTVTLTSGSETKDVALVIYGVNTSRGRRAISEYCEVE